MAHLMTHRPRMTNLRNNDDEDASHKRWETFSAFSYVIGGVLFIGGSVFFFPALAEHIAIGDWLYCIGSILYLMVTGHDLLEVFKYWKHHPTSTFADRIEQLCAVSYVVGCICFVVGSLCFLPSIEAIALGSWLFVIGSGLFILGALVNVLQVVEAPSLIYMQLFNFTVALFIIGSVLFVVASIPYLWHVNAAMELRLGNYAAAQFLIASTLFFIGGVAIYYRKQVHNKLESFCKLSGVGTVFIHDLRTEIDDKSHFEARHAKP